MRSGVLSLVLLVLLALVLLGCGGVPHLAGTNDAALEYDVVADPATGHAVGPALAAAGVQARMAAAMVPADVAVTEEGRVRVVVDADIAGGVDRLIEWRGGLTIARADDGQVLVSAGLARSPIESITPLEHGRALAIGLGAAAREAIARAGTDDPAARVSVKRGDALLATMPLAQAAGDPLVLRFGDDVLAYTRAYRSELLLGSPVLPPVHRASAAVLPPRRGLGAACALLPLALSFAWLFFVRRFDRARPEPLWLVVATFALGGLAIVPAGLVESACAAATPWLDPSVVTMGGQLWALPIATIVGALVVGGAEEGSKLLAAWSLARHRREFDEPVDGIVYGCAAALGFAAVENVKYFAFARMSGVVIARRAFETVPAHMFFGALWGYAMGRTLVSRRARVWPMFLLACLAHGAFDALLSTDGTQLFASLLVLVLAVAFVVLLRRALRHGAVAALPGRDEAPPTEPLPASALARATFRVGSPAAFAASAAGMVLFAFAMTVLGGAYELLQHRVGVVFVGLATLLLALFALAAYAASSTIPLDVAVDAQGVTFSGARTAWRDVVALTLEASGKRRWLRLQTRDASVRLGPADAATANAIAAAIRATKGSGT